MAIISEKFDSLFEKIKGGYFALIGGLFCLSMILVASILHSITNPISMFTHFVSNLTIGPNFSPIVFGIGTITCAVLLYPFVIYLCKLLWMEGEGRKVLLNKIALITAFITAMIAIPGLILLTFFPMAGPTLVMHTIGAMVFFIGSIIWAGLFLFSFELNGKSSNLYRISYSLIVIFFFAMFGSAALMLALYPAETALLMADPLNYIVSMLGNYTDPRLYFVRFFEWLMILSMLGTLIVIGIVTLRSE